MSEFTYPSCLPSIIAHGFLPLPGLRTLGQRLSPEFAPDAWRALLRAKHLISEHCSVFEDHWTLDDDGGIRAIHGYAFRRKPTKSHLSLTQLAATSLAQSRHFPDVLRRFFDNAAELIAAVDATIADIAPEPPFPTITNLRLFEYRDSVKGCMGMKGHIDGSRFTIVVAKSDGCLQILGPNKTWIPVVRPDKKPFAVMMPGRSFSYSGISATEHRVTPIRGRRYSTTIFETPDLGTDKLNAAALATKWFARKSIA